MSAVVAARTVAPVAAVAPAGASHSRSSVARAFFAGSCRPGAAICFVRVSSITVMAVSQAA